jgi:hypothetical protein
MGRSLKPHLSRLWKFHIWDLHECDSILYESPRLTHNIRGPQPHQSPRYPELEKEYGGGIN